MCMKLDMQVPAGVFIMVSDSKIVSVRRRLTLCLFSHFRVAELQQRRVNCHEK